MCTGVYHSFLQGPEGTNVRIGHAKHSKMHVAYWTLSDCLRIMAFLLVYNNFYEIFHANLLTRMKKIRTEEMAQSGKCLPGKHEDLKLNPQNLCSSGHVNNPNAGAV